MATTEHFRNGGGTTFSFVFPILANSDLNVEIYNATTKLWDAKTENTSGQTDNDYSISNTNVVFNSATPTGTGNVHIYRKTNVDNPAVVYAAGSSIRAVDLNDNQTQVLYSTQETSNQLVRESDLKDSIVSTDKLVDLNVTTAKLANNAVTNAKIADDAVDTAQLANGAVDTQQLAANSVNAAKIADDVINSEHYVDGSIDRVHLEADIIDSTKLADNAVNSEHYVDGSIDTEHIANYAISHDKLALNSVRSQNIVDGTVATSDIANSAVTTNKIANNAVDTTELANGAVTVAKIADGAVTTAKIGAGQVILDKLADNSVNTTRIVDGNVTTAKIANNAVTVDKIADAAVTIGKINNAVVVTNSEQASHSVNDITFFTTAAAEARYFNASTGETIKDGQSFPDNDTTIATTAAINDRIIDLVDDVGGFRPIPNQNSFPSTNPDVNGNAGTIVSVKEATTALTAQSGTTLTLPNGRGTGNAVIITGVSATIPQGFGFLVETTSTDHTYTFHRLVPKATEVTTVAGKATEIGRLGTAAAVADMAILGTADVVADMAILGTNDVVADLNTLGTADVVADLNTLGTADVVSDMNALATTNNITSMSTCKDNIASINNCSTNISSVNNYGDQYQVASNNPSTDGGGNALAAGDLYFNTSANELKVYNGSAWQAGVTATGNFALTTGNTFTGDNRYNDGVKALYGTGSDLEIYHTNNHSYIDNSTGSLFLRGDTIKLRPKSVDEDCIESFANGAVRLYYDNAEKFATVSIGANVTGRLRVTDYVDIANGADLFLTDNGKAVFGNGSDLQIYHDGGGSKIVHANVGDLQINNTSADTWIASDGVVRISNTSHNGYMAKFDEDGAVELYHNNVKKFETSSTGGILSGTKWTFLDNTKGTFGTGDDLQIYHSGSHSFIDHTNGTGHLIINSSASNNVDIMRAGHGEYMARFKPDNAAELYYDNSKKFETTSIGGTLTGHFNVTDTSSDSASARIYLQSGNTADSSVYFGRANDSATAALRYDHTSNALQLWGYNNSLRAEIDSTGNFRIPNDSGKLTVGSGNDLQMYHDGSNSYLDNSTGSFFVRGDTIKLRGKSADEDLIEAFVNGSVRLYHNNALKLETLSGGVQITGGMNVSGNASFGDNNRVKLGTGDDLQIYHNGADDRIDSGSTNSLVIASKYLRLMNQAANETMAKCTENAAVELNYDNSKKLETKSDGVLVTGEIQATTLDINGNGHIDGTLQLTNDLFLGDNDILKIGSSNDLQLYHNNNESWIQNNTGTLNILNDGTTQIKNQADNETIAQFVQNGSVRLFYDNSEKLYTDNAGIVVKGNLYLTDADDREIHMGANQDFRLLHDGTYNKIYGAGNHNMYFYTNGTLRTVIQTDGHLRPASNDTYDLGTSVDRWRNIYTADLQLSNEGKTNDVDGTWGNYTMQEGENDLFLINNRSGRKYKFNLTEVS